MSSSNKNKHTNSLVRREDFFLGVRCKTIRGGKRNCDGWMHPQLASYHENGPVYEELCCLNCSKVSRVKQVSRGQPRKFQPRGKED